MDRKERLQQEREQVPDLFKSLYDRVHTGKSGRAEAVKLFCLHCYGYQYAGASRCDNEVCPLIRFNPWIKSGSPAKNTGDSCVNPKNQTDVTTTTSE